MMLQNKENGLFISANFDSGEYMGTFTVMHDELKYANSRDKRFDTMTLLIGAYVGSYLDGTLNDMNKSEDYVPPCKGDYTNVDAVNIIGNEGICYAVTRYISSDQFKDEKTRILWEKTARVIEELQEHLGIEQ
jgi:hypothetical protein